MRIKVKSLQGDEYILDVHNDQLVSDLKASISEMANGISATRQKLVYRGRTMQDTSPISDYNLEEDCKVHLIVQKEIDPNVSQCSTQSSVASMPPSMAASTDTPCPMDTSNRLKEDNSGQTPPLVSNRVQSRFEIILRERLAKHFSPQSVERIMANLQNEIDADINSSSLDDLERLAEQKLNITNE